MSLYNFVGITFDTELINEMSHTYDAMSANFSFRIGKNEKTGELIAEVEVRSNEFENMWREYKNIGKRDVTTHKGIKKTTQKSEK